VAVKEVTEFLWQGDRLIAEETGDQYRTYVYEPDTFKPLALVEGFGKENANTYYYHLDHLGTPQELTNQQGKLVWSVTYRAYGNVVQQQVSEIDNPLRFQGQYHDPETGLHYNRHRYYNPNTGRFITPDPIGLAGGLNNYQYVPNPTGWVDPLGLVSVEKSSPDQTPVPPNKYSQIVSSVNGKVVSEYSLLDNGPLSANSVTRKEFQDSLAATFSGGRYAEIELLDDLVVHRAWHPGQSREFGAFWSLEEPTGSLKSRIDSALLPEWGGMRDNPLQRQQATRYSTATIPKGTRIYLGEVGSQGGAWVGGGSQLLVKDTGVMPEWKIGEGSLQ
jgi:RHS repeat-associated protein